MCLLDAQPTEEEREVWNQVDLVLQDSESILVGLREYKGASQEIRDVSSPEALLENSDYGGKPASLICGLSPLRPFKTPTISSSRSEPGTQSVRWSSN